jgi:hypothetical protein
MMVFGLTQPLTAKKSAQKKKYGSNLTTVWLATADVILASM